METCASSASEPKGEMDLSKMLASLDCIVHDGACAVTTVLEQK